MQYLLLSLVLTALIAGAHAANAQVPQTAPADPVADVAVANRILADQGVVDGFGHVSLRNPKDSKRFYIARSMAPALVTASDVLEVDIEACKPVGTDRNTYLERFIHCEIYKTRPDVNAIAHSHSPGVIPFGISKTPLRAVFHLSGFLGEGTPVFDIRQKSGDKTDMLVRDTAKGADLAQVLGAHAVVLMRGHGSTTVGSSIQQAVFRAVYTEVNAKLQAEAVRLGEPNYLTGAEAATADKVNDAQLSRPWELWKMRAMGKPADK
jgi:ribulose-5-phosphate 4-epimerase/fuculose-1-phosphate aldolase